jgi:hypothetical protein
MPFPCEAGRTVDHVPVLGKWSHWFHFCETCFREKINRGRKRFLSLLLQGFNTQIYFSLSYSPFRNFLFLFTEFRSALGQIKTVLGNPTDLVVFSLHPNRIYFHFLIGESRLDSGCGSRLEKVDHQGRVKFMYNSLTNISDIASLPAGLFSTPVKLSAPFLLNFLSPLQNVFMHLNAEMREIIFEFPFIVSSD